MIKDTIRTRRTYWMFADEKVVASAGVLTMSEPVAMMMLLHDGGCRGKTSRGDEFEQSRGALYKNLICLILV
jgi:hypothetical protein